MNVPEPILVSEPPVPPLPPPSWITPEKVVLRLLLPTVRFLAPKKAFPLPSIEPIVTLGAAWALISRLPLPKSSTRDVPPVEFSLKKICPPAPPFDPPFATRMAEPAVELSWKIVEPPAAPLTVPPLLVNIVEVPAVALLVKTISPNSPFAPTVVMKCCVLPELFVIPVPLILSVKGALAVKTYGHLRREHSIAQVQKVSFAPVATKRGDIVKFPLSA